MGGTICAAAEWADRQRSVIFPVRRLAPDGLEAWEQVIERRYEGHLAKRTRRACMRAG
jgi:hypothetical protein